MSNLFPLEDIVLVDLMDEIVIKYLMDYRDTIEEFFFLFEDPINLWDSINMVLSEVMSEDQLAEDSCRDVPVEWTNYILENTK